MLGLNCKYLKSDDEVMIMLIFTLFKPNFKLKYQTNFLLLFNFTPYMGDDYHDVITIILNYDLVQRP